MLEILATTLLAIPFRLATQSFLAMGRPRLQFDVIVVRLISLLLGMPLSFWLFGVSGALWGMVFSHFCYIPIIIYYNIKHHLFDVRTEIYLLTVLPLGLGAGKLSALIVSHWT
jgi:hypothetical protein